ncbi:MAG: hypothetical protein ACRCZK_00775 [Oscillospiraceae bacterium]
MNSRFNFVYGLFIAEDFERLLKLSILICKFNFILSYFIFSMSYNQSIFILFIILDLVFFLSRFDFIALFINVIYSFSIYFLMFSFEVLKGYLIKVDSTNISLSIGYISIILFTIFYGFIFMIFVISNNIFKPLKKGEAA